MRRAWWGRGGATRTCLVVSPSRTGEALGICPGKRGARPGIHVGGRRTPAQAPSSQRPRGSEIQRLSAQSPGRPPQAWGRSEHLGGSFCPQNGAEPCKKGPSSSRIFCCRHSTRPSLTPSLRGQAAATETWQQTGRRSARLNLTIWREACKQEWEVLGCHGHSPGGSWTLLSPRTTLPA